MKITFDTERFSFYYRDNRIESEVLWESHCHASFEMISVLEGEVSIMLEGREYMLSRGKALILPPLVYHTVTANKKGRYSRVTAFFHASALPEVIRDSFCANDSAYVVSCSYQTKELEKICKSERFAFFTPLAESVMTEIFYECVKSSAYGADSEIDETLERMLVYIDTHLSEMITIDGIARNVARSRSYVSHVFSEKMGITPKQYILSKKLALAQKYITQGMPSTEAAMRVGHDNYSDFYRIYKKHTGHSPSNTDTKKIL